METLRGHTMAKAAAGMSWGSSRHEAGSNAKQKLETKAEQPLALPSLSLSLAVSPENDNHFFKTCLVAALV